MKSADTLIAEMESSNILTNRELTFPEYANQLKDFQQLICKIIFGAEYKENMRIDEALFAMESSARKKNLINNPSVHKGISTMKSLEKEIAITISGINGEKDVFRTLEYLNRPNTQIFRNVYITNGESETELDAIILTDSGIIILEIKKVKSDITLTEEGRMVRNGSECYDKIPLGEKMKLKRNLLKSHLETILANKSLDIPVNIDSLIIFYAPKGQHIDVNDRYHKEKYCFRSNLNKKIEGYTGYTHYNTNQLTWLSDIFTEMECNKKRFETLLDFDEVRRNLAEAIALIQTETNQQVIPSVTNNTSPLIIVHKDNLIDLQQKREEFYHKHQNARKIAGFGSVAASLTGALLCSVSAIVAIGLRRA